MSEISKWANARLEADTVDPSDVVLIVDGEFAGNVGARVQQVGRVFDVDAELAKEMVRRWNLASSTPDNGEHGDG